MAITAGEIDILVRLRDEATNKMRDFERTISFVDAGLARMGITGAGLAATIVGVSAAAAAAGAAFLYMVDRGSQVEQVAQAFRSLGGGAEASAETLAVLRRETKGLVSDQDLMVRANNAVLLGIGFTDQQMGELSKTALVLGRAMGVGPEKALSDLTLALGRQSSRLLDNLGIMLKNGEANVEYAKRLGKTSDELTDAERRTAFITIAMERMGARVEQMGGLVLTSGDSISKLKIAMTNLTDATANWISTSTPVEFLFRKITQSAETWEGLLRNGARGALLAYNQVTEESIPKIHGQKNALDKANDALGKVSLTEGEYKKFLKDTTAAVDANVKAWERKNKALDEFGSSKAVSRGRELVQMLGDLGGPLKLMPEKLKSMADEFQKAAEGAAALGQYDLAMQFSQMAKTLQPLVILQQKYGITMFDAIPAAADFTQEILEQNTAFEKEAETIHIGVLPNLMDLTKAWASYLDLDWTRAGKRETPEAPFEREGKAVTQLLGDMTQALKSLSKLSEDGLGSVARWLGSIVSSANLANDATGNLKSGMHNLKGGAGDVAAGMLQLASGALAAAAALDQATRSADRAEASLGGASAGAQIGSAFGPIGTIIGAAGGFLLGFERSSRKAREEARLLALQVSEVQKRISDLIPPGIDAGEMFKELGLSVVEFGTGGMPEYLENLKKFASEFERKLAEAKQRIADMKAEIAAAEGELTTLLGTAKDMGYIFDREGNLISVRFQDMLTKAKKYGIDLASLGPSFQSARIHDAAQTIINDFTLLTRGGADVGGVLLGMSGQISKLVQDSIKFGVEIPANMKPWIQSLIDAGKLTDENGIKITDITKIKFGEPVKTEFDIIQSAVKDLVAKIQELIDNLARHLTPALDTATRDRTINVGVVVNDPGGVLDGNGNINVDVGSGDRERSSGTYDLNGDGRDENGYSVGTLGRFGRFFHQFKPQGEQVTVHGDEAIVRRDQTDEFVEQFGGGASSKTSAAGVSALLREFQGVRRDLKTMPIAIRDAIILSGAG